MADKRISQLNSHTSPSGSDLLVIVNNNETKKITYEDLKDSIVINSDNALLNAFSASYLNDSASFHTRINAATNEQDLTPYVTNIVYGVLSGSVDSRLDNVETFTQSIDSRVDSLESWSSSLDSTFATDLQVSIVSSSVAATIGVISQNTGLLSTSSFNEYTASQSTGSLVDRLNSIENVTSSYELKGSGILSGSVSYTDLTNIPSGIVSQSVDIANFTFTSQTITNDNITLVASDGDIVLDADGDVYLRSANAGNGIVTDGYLAGVIGDTNVVNNSTGNTLTDNLTNIINSIPTIPVGTISGSEQITAFGFISSSDSTTALNTYTSSLNTAFQITGSKINFLGDVVIYGTQSVINSQNVQISDNILYLSPTASTDNDLGIVGHYNDGTYRHAGIFMDASDGHSWKVFNGLQTETTATVDTSGTGFTLADFKAGVITGTSFNGIINSTNGIISGSSQLTSSYDSRYVLSGSVSAVPTGTISGSSQLTASFDGRYVQTGSFNTFTASALTTGSNSFNGNQTITGSLIVSSVAVVNGSISTPTGSLISLTSGSSIFVDSSGAITGSLTGSIFGIGDVSAFSSSVNTRLNNIISTPAGTISGSSQLTASYDTRYTLSGSVVSGTTPAGTISGSSQLTSSFDVRYETIGRGIVSGSSQLTSSYDSRYTLTSSFNSFTASAQAVTTGSNTFNGTQTITGSLNITNGNIIASQITANTASLYLTSGSNLYVQNNGIAEITGSLKITGSLTINSGSITMPDRPAFRVTGAGGATASTTILSGSMTIVDYNQGSAWNNANGTFTAPIAGLYQVNLVARCAGNSNPSAQIIVYKNNTTISPNNGTAQVMLEWAANTTANHIGGSTITKLAVGDTLKVIVTVGSISFDGNDNFSVAYIG